MERYSYINRDGRTQRLGPAAAVTCHTAMATFAEAGVSGAG